MAERAARDADDNPALVLGAAMGALARAGRDKLTFVIEPDLAPLGAWLEQLIAESHRQGRAWASCPSTASRSASPTVYGDDRVFVRLGPESDSDWHRDADASSTRWPQPATRSSTSASTTAPGSAPSSSAGSSPRPSRAPGLGVDPFDEPNVTGVEAEHRGRPRGLRPRRRAAAARAGGRPRRAAPVRAGRRCPAGDRATSSTALRGAPRARARATATTIWAPISRPRRARTDRLRAIQARLRDGTRRATTLGYGPRFLHSTGQLHKGGAPIGLLPPAGRRRRRSTCPSPAGRRRSASSSTRRRSGDFASLGAHGLPVLRIHSRTDADAGLDELAGALEEALA